MDINIAGNNLQAALLAAFNLDLDAQGPAGAEAAAAAVASVMCAFGEVIAATVFPGSPIECVEMVADETQANILAELRGLRADCSKPRVIGAIVDVPIADVDKLPFWMSEIAARSLCHRTVPDDGRSLTEVGAELTKVLLMLSAVTASR